MSLSIKMMGLHAKHIQIVATNCHSGAFIDDFSNSNTVVSTACQYNETSVANSYYNVFAKHWIDGMKDRAGDTNFDKQVSAYEAFDYAYDHTASSDQHPQFSSSGNIGDEVGLEDIWPNVSISGPSYFLSQGTFSIANQPASTSADWSIDKTYWTGDVAHTTTGTASGSTVNVNIGQSQNSYDIAATATISNAYKSISYAGGATTGKFGPHLGTLYWDCNSKSGGSNYDDHQTYAEFQKNTTTYFYSNYYQGKYGNRVNNPTISACDGLDLNPQTFYSNYLTVTPSESCEGDMMVYLENSCGEGAPFTVPFIVFDPLSFSLSISQEGTSMSLQRTSDNPSKSSIKRIEIQNEKREVLFKQILDHTPSMIAAQKQTVKIPKLDKGTYIIKIEDDKPHFIKIKL